MRGVGWPGGDKAGGIPLQAQTDEEQSLAECSYNKEVVGGLSALS